jgi:DNA-directed RNA polymerase subunit F
MRKKTKIIKPPNLLKIKVGSGGINKSKISEANEYIEKNTLDFKPYAEEYIQKMKKSLKHIKKTGETDKEAINSLIKPIMELKGNGAMFNYPLVSDISDIILNFLENLDTLNQDAIDIVDVHEKTLHIIVKKKLSGSGGSYGTELVKELMKACNRYYDKHNITEKGIGSI